MIKKNTVRITRPVGNSHTTVQYRRTKMSLDGCRSSSLNVRSRKMRRIPLIVGGYILFPSPTISTGLENIIADTADSSSELQKDTASYAGRANVLFICRKLAPYLFSHQSESSFLITPPNITSRPNPSRAASNACLPLGGEARNTQRVLAPA